MKTLQLVSRVRSVHLNSADKNTLLAKSLALKSKSAKKDHDRMFPFLEQNPKRIFCDILLV